MIDSNKKLIRGIGINDTEYNTRTCQHYSRWSEMLRRCYYSTNVGAYIAQCKALGIDHELSVIAPIEYGNTVCKEWLLFSNFRAWAVARGTKGSLVGGVTLFSGNEYRPSRCSIRILNI